MTNKALIEDLTKAIIEKTNENNFQEFNEAFLQYSSSMKLKEFNTKSSRILSLFKESNIVTDLINLPLNSYIFFLYEDEYYINGKLIDINYILDKEFKLMSISLTITWSIFFDIEILIKYDKNKKTFIASTPDSQRRAFYGKFMLYIVN